MATKKKRAKKSKYLSAKRALAAIANIVYPGGKIPDYDRDALEQYDQICGVLGQAGLTPKYRS